MSHVAKLAIALALGAAGAVQAQAAANGAVTVAGYVPASCGVVAGSSHWRCNAPAFVVSDSSNEAERNRTITIAPVL